MKADWLGPDPSQRTPLSEDDLLDGYRDLAAGPVDGLTLRMHAEGRLLQEQVDCLAAELAVVRALLELLVAHAGLDPDE